MKRIYIRIIGLALCLPFIYILTLCAASQPAGLILPCALGAGTGLAIEVDVALAIGLYLLVTGGWKGE